MNDPKTNRISFPHLWYGDKLGGKTHQFNNINGGFIPVTSLGIVPNSFFGGNVDMLGLVLEYGFYICPNRWNNQVVGFYVHDPSKMTELGRKLFEEKFASTGINWEPISEQKMSAEEKKRWEELKAEAVEKGLGVELVTNSSMEGLVNALATIERGVNQNIKTEVVEAPKEPAYSKPKIVTQVSKPQF